MTETFEPYYEWLSIPPHEMPPDHYRLLGIERFETDAKVIGNAADRQMAHIRRFQTGPRAAHSQKLLSELAIAYRCLATASSKSAYDVVLQSAAPAERYEAQQEPGTVQPADGVKAIWEKTPIASKPEYSPYRIIERTAASNLWISYKVQHAQTGRYYSLKTLPLEAAKSVEVVKRFRREIEIVTKLDHPNLIAGVDSGERDGVPYLITEYVVGTDLATLVKSQGPLAVPLAIDYIVQAARGLTQLHLHGVYHRNLKPQSLLVDLQGRLKVSNLLMAKVEDRSELAHDEDLTRQGTLLGSADFLPPEQAVDASSIDGRSDIYALGCVLCFLLLARPPYPGKSVMDKLKAHKLLPIPDLRAVRADVPEHIQQVIAKMMAKEPTQRYSFVADVIDALCPRDVAKEVERRVNYGLVFASGAALVVVLGVVLGIALSN